MYQNDTMWSRSTIALGKRIRENALIQIWLKRYSREATLNETDIAFRTVYLGRKGLTQTWTKRYRGETVWSKSAIALGKCSQARMSSTLMSQSLLHRVIKREANKPQSY